MRPGARSRLPTTGNGRADSTGRALFCGERSDPVRHPPSVTAVPSPDARSPAAAATERRALREHLWLVSLFTLSRAGLWLAGLRHNFDLGWMWLADPADLRTHLLRTLYYFHAFPPGMNLLTGLLLKLGGAHAATLALVAFWALGLLLSNALFYLCRSTGLSFAVSLLLSVVFSLTPQAIYFEHLYLYEAPIAALVCSAALFFFRAVLRSSSWSWCAFFLCCAAIGLTRSTFHLLWFVAMVGLAGWFSPRERWRKILAAAAVPGLLLLSLYLKNWAVFGIFDAFSFGPVSLNLVTTQQLSKPERDAWIAEHRLSPFAALGVFAGPREYLPYFPGPDNPAFPPELSRLERPSLGAPNFNHWLYLQAMPTRKKDAYEYVRERPFAYLSTVFRGLADVFSPSTTWHPRDTSADSPHYQHRQVLGGYERFYNRFVHRFPVAPIGLYIFLPIVLAWAIWRAQTLGRFADSERRALGALLWFCVLQIAYVVFASTVFTFHESARYRYQIESLIWLLTALAIQHTWRKLNPPSSASFALENEHAGRDGTGSER